jgi:hypothetical protein
MKLFFIGLIMCVAFYSRAQPIDSLLIPAGSILKGIKTGDSVIYYQCHVEEAVQQMATASGQTITSKPQKFTITEKFVVLKTASGYSVNYYTSSLNVFPNKKFSGLKIKERPYWEFKKERSFTLRDKDLNVFLALEKKGREAIEYDFAITRYSTNQLIIKQRKNFKQLVIDGGYVISKLVAM